MKRISLLSALFLGVLIFSGCGNKTAQPSGQNQAAAPVESGSITIENFAFNPGTLTVKKGGTVTWTNNDSVTHQIAADNPAELPGFGSGQLGHGQSYSFTFDNPGTFSYHCSIHPAMKGNITVQ